MVTGTITNNMAANIIMIMNDPQHRISPTALLRQQGWLSPAFPTGSYSYSHAVEWAVEAGHIHDCKSLVDWLEADVCHGSGRNEAIFFVGAWDSAADGDYEKLVEVADLASAFRSTSEFALETSQQAAACLTTFRRVWPDPAVETLSELLAARQIVPALPVVLGVRAEREGIPVNLALPAFLQSYLANLVTAGVRLIPLGQTEGQLAIAQLEPTVIELAMRLEKATMHDLGSAGFMVDLSSALHETQYTRLFRS